MIHSEVPIRRWGMWWFIASEIVTFGGMIATYILFRFRHPEWTEAASHAIMWVGSINTAVLLTSSLTIILSHFHVAQHNVQKAANYLVITMLLGLVFVGFKGYEYTHEIALGLLPGKSLFWAYYYLMTGLHLLHVVAGIVAIGIVWIGLRREKHVHRVEAVGIYWHFVDVVWIFLFPLLYVAS